LETGAKTRSPQNFAWGFNRKWCKNNKSPNFVWGLNNNNKKQSKNNMSHKLRLGAIIIIIIRRNGAKTRSPQNFLWGLNNKKWSKHNMSPKLCLGGHNYSKS
jgi:hypothetical protein